ncbi:MAG: hypothetical protein JWP38_1121 [Herbaspirillum sp.]|nr:hypothetical protein [Herbaspirillum sp.]
MPAFSQRIVCAGCETSGRMRTGGTTLFIYVTPNMSLPHSEALNDMELRILLGPQAGATLPLIEKNIVIGADEQCDVILQSPGIAPRHARLSLTTNRFSLDAIDGEVIAADRAQAAAPWKFGTTIYLGDVALTVDRGAARWNTASPLPQNNANAPRKMLDISLWSNKLLQRWKRWALITTALLTLSVGTQAIIANHSQAAAGQALSSVDKHSIEMLIARYGRGAGLTLDTSHSRPVVRGYLPTVKQVNALKKSLLKWHDGVIVDVQAEDILLAASRHFLNAENSHLKVRIVNGQAQLSGFDIDKRNVKRIAGEMKKSVAGLAGVNATFVAPERLEEWLQAWRKGAPTDNREIGPLRISTTAAGDLELHGTLTPQWAQQLSDTLTRRSLQKNMLLPLRIVTAAPAGSANQPPAVRAFSAGAVPYVFLTNGRRVMIGGAVDGFHLVAINQTGPIFQRYGG